MRGFFAMLCLTCEICQFTVSCLQVNVVELNLREFGHFHWYFPWPELTEAIIDGQNRASNTVLRGGFVSNVSACNRINTSAPSLRTTKIRERSDESASPRIQSLTYKTGIATTACRKKKTDRKGRSVFEEKSIINIGKRDYREQKRAQDAQHLWNIELRVGPAIYKPLIQPDTRSLYLAPIIEMCPIWTNPHMQGN